MRIVSWNILQGGGRRLAGICAALVQWQPDIVVLQEVRRSSVSLLSDTLEGIGLGYHYFPQTQSASENALYLASREPVDAGDFLQQPTRLCHILEAETLGLTLLPVHFPQKAAQVPLFEALLDDSVSLLQHECLLIGDLNCGVPFQDSSEKTFVNTRYFQALLEAGWSDLYRLLHGEQARDYSWISPRTRRGFRYDHALGGPTLARRVSALQYEHSVRERRLSDHSALLLDMD